MPRKYKTHKDYKTYKLRKTTKRKRILQIGGQNIHKFDASKIHPASIIINIKK